MKHMNKEEILSQYEISGKIIYDAAYSGDY